MKIKYFIFGSIVTVVLFIIVNILLVINNNEIINIKTISNFDEQIGNVDRRIEKIKNNECKQALSDMSNNIKKTHFNNNVSVSDYYHAYFDGEVFINIYARVLDQCKIEEESSRYILALSSMSFPENVKTRYNLKHEFIFKDKDLRSELLKESDEIGSYTSKALELNVINELLDGIKK